MENDKKKVRMYQMSSEVALTFFELCKKLNATTEKERHAILRAMANLGLMKSVIETGRTRDQIVRDMSKHYRVLDLRGNNNDDSKGAS